MEKLKQTFTKNGYEYSLIDRTTDHYFYKVLHTEAELKGRVVGYEIGFINKTKDADVVLDGQRYVLSLLGGPSPKIYTTDHNT